MVWRLALKPVMALFMPNMWSIAAACGRVKLARWLACRYRYMRVSIFILSPKAWKDCNPIYLSCGCLMNALITKKTQAKSCLGRLNLTQSRGAWMASLTISNLIPFPKISTILSLFWKRRLTACLFWLRPASRPFSMALRALRLITAI